MKSLFKYTLLWLLLVSLTACGGDDEYDAVAQQEDFQTFLDGKQLEYDEDLAAMHYIYKVTVNEGNSRNEVVQTGDRIAIYYAGYLYNKSVTANNYGLGGVFTTNDPELSLGLGWYENPNTDPLEITLGDGNVLRGLNLGIPGSRVGDTFLLYLSADYAYGEGNQVGLVETKVPVVFEIYIDRKISD